MRKVHEKSIVLGIGIGMIITSIAGMIYSGGVSKELSKEEIIRLAKGYGMVERVPFLPDDDPAAQSTASVSTPSENTASASTADVSTASDSSVSANTQDKSENNAAAQSSTADNTAASEKSTPAEKTTTKTDTSVNSTKSVDAVTTDGSSDSNERDITVKVNPGTRAKTVMEDLMKKGIITDENEFMSILKSYEATTKIRSGTYKFKKNDDPDYVVRTICKMKT